MDTIVKNKFRFAWAYSAVLIGILGNAAQAQDSLTVFGRQALNESVVPVRPGVPGKSPFWNAKAPQFIYAPAFDYTPVQQAVMYRFVAICADKSQHVFKSKEPYTPLSEIWKGMPTGKFNLRVVALNQHGDSIGTAGSGSYYKAAFFNGPYHKPLMPYDQSGKLALESLLKKDYINYWFDHKEPDPSYQYYRYPAKIYSAIVIGAVTEARLKPNTPDAKRSVELAKIVADYMIKISYKKGSEWEYFVPTYFGPRIKDKPGSHIQLVNNFTIMGADAGHAYLDLYDISHDSRYLDAAKRILNTYLKTQMANGTWYQLVNYETGKPAEPIQVIPTAMVNYFDRLRDHYGVKGLDAPIKKAVDWIMNNPVKTFNWQAQFEDVKPTPAYKRHSREQACDFAVYLMKNKINIPLAEELMRFAEDQFVIWEKPLPITIKDNPDPEKSQGWNSKNWITPSVQEQYGFWMPVARTAGVMMDTYMQAYLTTKKKIYLAKAQSIANALELSQAAHNGDYPTMFTKYDMNFWLNSAVYPAKVMMELSKVK